MKIIAIVSMDDDFAEKFFSLIHNINKTNDDGPSNELKVKIEGIYRESDKYVAIPK